MTRSYRRHVLWRTLTRTRYLLTAAVVVAVVAVALDHHPRAKDCTWYYSANRGEVGECVPHGQLPPPGWHTFGPFRTPVPRTSSR